MKKCLHFLFVLCISHFSIIFFGYTGHAQTPSDKQFHKHHTLGFIIGHTYLYTGVQADGTKKWKALPSIALNYNFKWHPKWAIGLHNEIVIEDYEVNQNLRSGASSNEILRRAYPVASVITGSFQPANHWVFMLGAGGEFSHTGNLGLIRLGIEYLFHINKHWEFNAVIVNDVKINAYNSISAGIGLTRIL